MPTATFGFQYEVFDDVSELNEVDAALLIQARSTTETAYAPYSNFQVAACAELENGAIITGTNQENASYPVGICAERVLLSAASSMYPNVRVTTMAITYHNLNAAISDKPASPCGMCRQALSEHENRYQKPIRIILSGMEGKVFVIETAQHLLPLSFSGSDLNG